MINWFRGWRVGICAIFLVYFSSIMIRFCPKSSTFAARMEKKDKREEFGRFFKAQYPKSYYYALQLLKEPEASRDVVSEVFAYVWENLDSMNLQTLPAFVQKTVRNKCLDLLRHNKVELQYADYYLHAVDECYMDGTESQERQQEVERMLDLLPETTRHVLTECYLHHKKYKEVAEEMQVCQETVKRHIMRALKILREQRKTMKS